MLSKVKSGGNLLKNKDISLQQLAKLNSQLDLEQSRSYYINKEIHNQTQIGKKNDRIINKQFDKINLNGEELVRKYEEEKEKNEKLVFLVQHIENDILKEKVDKANNMKHHQTNDQLLEACNDLLTREKDLEKISEKTNSVAYDLSRKIDNIRALRSQRTIVSTLFDKFERELCNLEHCYKVLVIERKKEEDEWDRAVDQFNQYQSSGNKELNRLIEKNIKLKDMSSARAEEKKEEAQNLKPEPVQNQRMSMTCTFFEQLVPPVEPTLKDRLRQKSSKFEDNLMKLDRERTVKAVFNELGVSCSKELPQSLADLEKVNQQLLLDSNRLFEQIEKAEQSVYDLQPKKTKRESLSQRKQKMSSRKVKLNDYQHQTTRNKLQLGQFKECCKIVLKNIAESRNQDFAPPQLLNEEQELIQYLTELQNYFQFSYIEEKTDKTQREITESKKLNFLLASTQTDHNNLSIYQEEQFLEMAKRHLQRSDKTS